MLWSQSKALCRVNPVAVGEQSSSVFAYLRLGPDSVFVR